MWNMTKKINLGAKNHFKISHQDITSKYCGIWKIVLDEYNMFNSNCEIPDIALIVLVSTFSKLVIQQECINQAIYQYLFII